MNIREVFKNEVTKGAFKEVDGVTRIIGKYGEIEILGNLIDVYFIGPNRTPLHGRRIASIRRNLRENAGLIELNGEAFLQTKDLDLARSCIPFLGVRKKVQYSAEAKVEMAARMKEIRKSQ